jgi:hypothetical protein
LVKGPKLLCTPVDVAGSGIKQPARHLVCYKVLPAPGQPKHLPQVGLRESTEFGAEFLDTKREDVLCLPSSKTP